MMKNWIVGMLVGIGSLIILYAKFFQKKAAAISIIGGADGPTSVFIAGKTGNSFGILLGICLIVIAFAILFLGKK